MAKKITMKMIKDLENEQITMNDVLFVAFEHGEKVGRKLLGKKPKNVSDVSYTEALMTIFFSFLMSNDLSADRRKKGMELFVDAILKESMTSAVYNKYSEAWKNGKLFEGLPNISNEEFDELFN